MMLEKIFQLKAHNTTIKTELTAGVITFLTMSYILVINPIILGQTGMDKAALFTATALAAAAGTMLMALLANVPVAQAPGMGLNSFFAASVVQIMGYSWQFALTAVLIESIIFVILTFFDIRKIIVDSIPATLKAAIPVGIGLFITLIGLQHSGLIVNNESTMISLGSFSDKGVWVALAGLFLTGALLARNVPGAILIGILFSTIFGLILGITSLPEGRWVDLPPSIAPVFAKFEWANIFTLDMLIVVFTFLFVNMFDSVGTLLGIASKAGLIDKAGNFPKIKKALLSCSLGAFFGAIVGTSPVSSYVESAAGVTAGGRTGLTTFCTACLFILALFLAPIFLMVPAQATAPVLIIVGLFMLSSVIDINFNDFTESLPAYLTIIMMPFSYSIAQGIIFGMLGFVFIKLLAGKYKNIKLTSYVISGLFLLKIIVDILHTA